jgi:UrcA family protein
MSRLITSAALLAALALAAPVAMAQKAAPQIVVSYGDLDLQSGSGMDTLFKRIERASRGVCGKRPTTVMNGVLHRFLACHDATISAAVRNIDNPSVSLAWAARNGAETQIASR